jgi:hypothetical protein
MVNGRKGYVPWLSQRREERGGDSSRKNQAYMVKRYDIPWRKRDRKYG